MDQKDELLNDIKNLAKLIEEEDFEEPKTWLSKNERLSLQTFASISRKNIYITERKIGFFAFNSRADKK